MEVTIDAGDLFYVNVHASQIEALKLSEEKEVWINFSTKDIILITGNQ